MDQNNNDKAPNKVPKDVDELLLPDDSAPKINLDENEGPTRKKRFFTAPVIVIIVVAILSGLGIAYIYSDDILAEQFSAMMAGELGEYKEQLRKIQEDKIRDIENLTGNKYGSVTLYYSPRDAKVIIKQHQYAHDCSDAADDDALLACLKEKVDYSQDPIVEEIDNPSLHLDREKKEVVEEIPLNDIPIQEASDDRKTIYKYELTVEIDREGYHPRKFFLTGDRDRQFNEEGWEVLFWDQKGPGIYMVNFQGADLMPEPETAKENYMNAVKGMECIKREIDAKRKEGKTISDDTISGLYIEILNRNGFQTFENFDRIDQELRKDEEWYKEFMDEVAKITCE